VERPLTGRVLAAGRNYRKHAAELGNRAAEEPFFFLKDAASAVGHGEEIVIPRDLAGEVHHEAELAVVIGREGRRIPEENALDWVDGCLCANDITARTVQFDLKERGLPWFGAKVADTFLAIGPGKPVMPANPGDLAIICRVNGEVRQEDRTSSMVHSVQALVAAASLHLTLQPGDVLLTGTPAGVGPLRAGDVVEVEIEGVGTLSNPVVAEAGA
jgi:2-keto-4-pentenoate hydratase/2-oxohepta-3-ene-1,7-dioic acid hydratase in catechol pathway